MARRPSISKASEEITKKILCFLHYQYANSEDLVFTEKMLFAVIPEANPRIIHFALEGHAATIFVDEEEVVEDVDEGEVDEEGEIVLGCSITRSGIMRVEEWDEDDYAEISEGIDFLEDNIPASDRVVSLDHNSAAYKDATKALDELIETVRIDNEYGDRAPDEKEQLVASLTAGRRLLNAATIRLSAAYAILLPPLRYVADNFGKGAITAAGALALAAMVKLLGIL